MSVERVILERCGGDFEEDWDVGAGGSVEAVAVLGLLWDRLALKGTVLTLEVRQVALQLTSTFEFWSVWQH